MWFHQKPVPMIQTKKSSGVPTDITEDVIRAMALPLGFVDIKVCAVDDTWSAFSLRPYKPGEERQSFR